ncbi:hypothetical protein BH11ACT3_BH11ACT3_11470 [soil metagenome]
MATLDNDARISQAIRIESALVKLATIQLQRDDLFDHEIDRLELAERHLRSNRPTARHAANSRDALQDALRLEV